MKSVLITGVNGFVGKHMARHLKSDPAVKVYGLGQEETAPTEMHELLDGYFSCDLTDADQVTKLPFETLDAVINLAGLANVGASFDNPQLYQKVNVDVLKNMVDTLHHRGLSKVRVLAISTGAVYDPNQDMPLTESSRLIDTDSTSPYVASKIAMERVAEEANRAGIDCIVVRPFNHIGPGQLPGFLVPDLFTKLSNAKATNEPTITVGNLHSKRDYTDVRDVVAAYAKLALAEKESLHSSIYNVCSGTPAAGTEILDKIQAISNTHDIGIVVDESLVRPNDPPVLFGLHEKITQDTGWEPTIPLETTLLDFYKNL